MSNQLLTASEFAKICHVTPRTIRWYQSIGLLKPIKVDKWNKYAYFEPVQAIKVFKIKLFQQLNIPLNDMKDSLRKDSIEQEVSELEKKIKEKQEEVNFLKKLNTLLYQTSASNLLKAENIGPFGLLSLTIKSGDYYKISFYLENLRKVAKNLGLRTSEGITFYLDSTLKYKPKNSPLEIAFKTKNPKSISIPSGYKFRQFSKTGALVFEFKTPSIYLHDIYLPLVYKKLDKYISDKKIRLHGPVFEIYDKNLSQGKSSGEIITKIYYPIATSS